MRRWWELWAWSQVLMISLQIWEFLIKSWQPCRTARTLWESEDGTAGWDEEAWCNHIPLNSNPFLWVHAVLGYAALFLINCTRQRHRQATSKRSSDDKSCCKSGNRSDFPFKWVCVFSRAPKSQSYLLTHLEIGEFSIFHCTEFCLFLEESFLKKWLYVPSMNYVSLL